MLYFGVRDKNYKGHFVFDNTMQSGGKSDWRISFENYLIYTLKIDGRYCPTETKAEGVARISYVDGLTVLGFWDYSGDPRGGCNSNFIEIGRFSFDQMIARARDIFPSIFERFDFEVIPES